MPLSIPNASAASFLDQAAPDSLDFQAIGMGLAGTGVFSGCAVTAHGSGMLIDVAAGIVMINYVLVTVAAQASVAVTAADGTNGRYDVVSINSSGTVVVTAGAPAIAGQAVDPALPANSALIAVVWVPATQTVVLATWIVDKRVNVCVENTVSAGSQSGIAAPIRMFKWASFS